MRYWWVNQNQTYKFEVHGKFMWSPKTKANGHRNQFYDNMQEVQAGDIIFSFCDTRIRAVGVATGRAQSSPKPQFRTAGSNWSNEGWYVPVEFGELEHQIRPKDFIEQLLEHLPAKYSPLSTSGDGLQSVYLAAVPNALAERLIELIGPEYTRTLQELSSETPESEESDDAEESSIRGRTDIGATTKDQLVRARRGQGIFKANVKLNESKCRVTGISEIQHLRASHIKPWKDSNDEEKLNGCNGLLLSPHIDHLFDRGMISFTANGDLLVSSKLDRLVLQKWGVTEMANVGAFNDMQSEFLAYHRDSVFKK
ncbi:HNH endonuclease [Cupriavidus sp.]|uniref:HNH endonuclease n=1 Tax=Cupriavidus sp. TaxID=1873897 RepID=UPI0028BDFA04|nr:HNH endonuclease [Cupriavidus sp.]